MKDASARIARECRDLRQRAAVLTVGECEGDALLFPEIQTALRSSADEVELRGGYLKTAPWNFVHANTPEGAQAFLSSARSRPLPEQDLLTQHLYITHVSALESTAAGNACPEVLEDDVNAYGDTPLDESAGEGYHRGTNLTRMRARAAKSPFLKQSTRAKANNRLLKQFIAMGPPGKRVLRFEWRRWQRVLQVHLGGSRRALWRPKRMKPHKVFERIYRMDEKAEEDWSAICEPVRAPGQGPPAADLVPFEPKEVKQLARLRCEYLASVLQPKKWYEIFVPSAGMDEDGQPVVREERKVFQLLNRVQAKSRPRLMPTIESHSHPVNTDRLALCIQEVSVRGVEGDGGEGSLLAYADSDSRWVRWSELGPWNEVQRSLAQFQVVQGAPEHAGCLILRDAEAAKPEFALTDLRCPTLLILTELKRRRWRLVKERVEHTDALVGPMDTRAAGRMKAYYIVLWEIDRCAPLGASTIPCDQPIVYYQLLLSGRAVLPGLGSAHYLAIQQDREPAVASPPPLEDESDDSGDYNRPPGAKPPAPIALIGNPFLMEEEGDPMEEFRIVKAKATAKKA